MKVLAFGDLQVNHNYPDYMDYVQKTTALLIDVIRIQRPDYVINLGDTFDTFGVLDARDIVFVHEMTREIVREVDQLHGVDSRRYLMIMGNHDVSDADGASALQVFEDCGCDVVLRPTEWRGRGIGVLPYVRDLTEARSFIETLARDPAAIELIVGHVDWTGARLTPKRVEADGLDPEWLKEMMPGTMVLNGHYHTPQYVPPVYIVGSPVYKDFGDHESSIARGFTLYEDGAIQQVGNPYTYRLRRIDALTEEELRAALEEAAVEGTKVKVFVPSALLPVVEEYRDRCLWMGAFALDAALNRIDHKVCIDVTTEPADIVARAVEAAPDTFDKTMLAASGKELFIG